MQSGLKSALILHNHTAERCLRAWIWESFRVRTVPRYLCQTRRRGGIAGCGVGELVWRHFDSLEYLAPYINTGIMQSVWGCLHLLMKLQTHMHKHFSHHMSGLSTSHLARVWSTTALTRCNDTTCLTASLEPEDKVEWLEIATKTRAWRGDKRETEHERMHRHTIA